MPQFLHENVDLAFFYYGLAYILMGIVCLPLRRDDRSGLPWAYLGAFAFLLGAVAWMNLLAISFGDSLTALVVRLVLMSLSFFALAEFGRRALVSTGYRSLGPWIHLIMLALTMLGSVGGLEGMKIAPRYFIAIPGGILTVWALVRVSRRTSSGRTLLLLTAVCVAVFTAASGFVGARAAVFPARYINQEWLESISGIRIQDVRAALAVIMALILSLYYSALQNRDLRIGLRAVSGPFSVWLLPVLLLMLTGGWVAASYTGSHFRHYLLRDTYADAAYLTSLLQAHVSDTLDYNNLALLRTEAGRFSENDDNHAAVQLFVEPRDSGRDTLIALTEARVNRLHATVPFHDYSHLPPVETWDPGLAGLRMFVDDEARILFLASPLIKPPANTRRVWVVMSTDLRDASTGFSRSRLFPLSATLFITLALIILDLAWRRFRDSSIRIARSEFKYRSLVEYSPEAVLIAAHGNIRFANASAARMFGAASPEELQATSIARLVPSSLVERTIVLGDFENSEADRPIELPLNRIDGGPFDAEVAMVPISFEENPAVMILARDISERRRAESAAQESRKRYADLFEESLAGNYVTAPDGRILLCNSAFARMLGYSSVAEVLGTSAQSLYRNPDERAAFLSEIQAHQRKEHFEVELVRKDGTILHAFENVIGMFDESGALVRLEGNIVDISERIVAEHALRESELRFRSLFNSMMESAALFDPVFDSETGVRDFRVVDCNEAFVRLVGMAREQAIGRLLSELRGGQFPPNIEGAARVLATGVPEQFEDYVPFLDVHLRVSLFAPGNGQLAMVSADITEHRRAEDALRNSERQFRELTALLPVGIYECDITGRITFANQQAFTDFGYSPEDLDSGIYVKDVMADDEQARAMRDIRQVLEGKPVSGIEYRARRKDGSVFPMIAYSTAIERGDKVVGVRGGIVNISGRKQAEAALRESENTLRGIFRAAPIGIGIVTNDRVLTWTNDYVCHMLGYTTEELLGQNTRMLYKDEQEYQKVALIQHPEIARRGVGSIEIKMRRKDGQLIDVLLSSSTLDGAQIENGLVFTLLDITERKRTETALSEANRQRRALFDEAFDAIFIADDQGVIIDVNKRAVALLGRPRDEIVGSHQSTLHPPEIREDARRHFADHRTNLVHDRVELTVLRGNGERVPVEISASVITLDDGRRLVQGIFRDITERKRAVEALRKSESLLRESQQIAYIGSYELDIATGQWTGSQALDALFGIDASFARTIEGWTKLIHPDSRDQLRDYLLQEVIGKGKRFDIEYRIVRSNDGRERWVHGLGELECDSEGVPLRMVGTIQDITNRKIAEEQIRKLSRAVEQSSSGILITDSAGRIEYANAAFSRMTGYDFDELRGNGSEQFFMNNMTDETRQAVMQSLGMGTEWRGEFQSRRKNGESYWEYTIVSPIFSERGVVTNFVAISEDVTNRHQAEAERTHLEEQLRQAQKMEAIGRLAGGVAHDFNNVLTAISGHAELALIRLRQEDPIRPDVEEVIKGANRASNLTRQLLAFSRRQVIEPQVLDLNMIIAEMQRMLGRIIGEDISLETRAKPDLWKTRADHGQIEQVIVNLAVNARDAMPRGGSLRLVTSNIVLDEAYCATHVDVKPGEYVLLKVQDTGTGMSEETISRVFEPFFTTKPTGVGTGLGLATVYGIIKQAGGHIAVESELGKGTEFSIFLPKTEGSSIVAMRNDTVRRDLRGTETVLIVEDNEAIRETIQQALEHFGYKTVVVEDGEKALTVCRGDSDKIDLVLSDVIMPGIGGLDLVAQIRAQWPRMKVLLMSGYTDTAVVPSPELPFIQKPFRPQSLAQKIRDIFDARVDANKS